MRSLAAAMPGEGGRGEEGGWDAAELPCTASSRYEQ